MSTRTVEEVVKLLNEALELDREAIEALFASRVPVNAVLRDHPTIQVLANASAPGATLGVLGLLNGIFGLAEDGGGYIASRNSAETDDGNHILEFVVRDPKKHPRVGGKL